MFCDNPIFDEKHFEKNLEFQEPESEIGKNQSLLSKLFLPINKFTAAGANVPKPFDETKFLEIIVLFSKISEND